MDEKDRLFGTFTEQARHVLSFAQEEARRFQHGYIGTEHLLLGLIREDEGIAAKVLIDLGVKLDKIRSAMEFIIGGRRDPVVPGELDLTPRAKKVIELATDEARRLNHPYIGTEHLLLGLVREGAGIAAGILESLGVNLEDARSQTMKVLGLSGHFFLSYSRRDFYFAESLFYALQSKGIDTWMDVWKITPGDNWAHAITNAIHSAKGLILVATKESLQSPNVRDEICWALQNHKPLYVIIRGRFSKKDLDIEHEYPDKTVNTFNLCDHAKVIVDMRAGFTKGVEKIAAAVTANTMYREKLPGLFNFKREKTLYIPPVIVFLAIFMAITELWKFGVGFFYIDQFGQLMGYIRDIIHGAMGELLLLVPTMIESIVSIAALVNIIIFSFNFSRRKRIGVNHFVLLLASAILTGLITLFTDVPAFIVEEFLKQGEPFFSLNKTLSLLLIVHGILFLLIIILGILFFYVKDGRGAILRWLPTGYASAKIRRKGNEEWLKNLPDSSVSPGPFYQSYRIMASSEDFPVAEEIGSMLQSKGYRVTANSKEAAECDLVILSPFADDSLLRNKDSRPVIYVLSRSMKLQKGTSVLLQWIDYRQPTPDQFWKQWEKHFSQLKSANPVFPYVPETLGDSVLPLKYGCGIRFVMIAVVIGSALLISGMEYLVLLRNVIESLLLPTGIVFLLGSVSLSYYTLAQMLRGVISPNRVRQWVVIAGIFTVIAALTSQSLLFIVGSLGVVLVNMFIVKIARPFLHPWLPSQSRKSHKKSLFQPISNYKTYTSIEYRRIMVAGFLGLNVLITNLGIIPNIPPQSVSMPYAVTVPGPYYLATPGLWSQDTYAEAFGYYFDYHPDKLEISQDQVSLSSILCKIVKIH